MVPACTWPKCVSWAPRATATGDGSSGRVRVARLSTRLVSCLQLRLQSTLPPLSPLTATWSGRGPEDARSVAISVCYASALARFCSLRSHANWLDRYFLLG